MYLHGIKFCHLKYVYLESGHQIQLNFRDRETSYFRTVGSEDNLPSEGLFWRKRGAVVGENAAFLAILDLLEPSLPLLW